MKNLASLILAGGNSTRMGTDKALLELDGATLLERQVRLMGECEFSPVYVSSRKGLIYAVLATYLKDEVVGLGPLHGISRGLESCEREFLIVVAVDMPKLHQEFLEWMAAQVDGEKGLVLFRGKYLEPLCSIYPKSSLELIRRQHAESKLAVKDFAQACMDGDLCVAREVPDHFRECLTNWNYPQDYEKR